MRPPGAILLMLFAMLTAVAAGAAEPDAGSRQPAQQPADGGADRARTTQAPPVPPVPVTEAGPTLLTEDLREGIGEPAHSGMSVAVHYTGWLHEPDALGYRGKRFDSSRDRGQPLVFQLGAGRVIKGWELGIVGMRVGGLRRLVIPPGLAYGNRGIGNGLIPPNSTLVFEVELLGVESNDFVRNAR